MDLVADEPTKPYHLVSKAEQSVWVPEDGVYITAAAADLRARIRRKMAAAPTVTPVGHWYRILRERCAGSTALACFRAAQRAALREARSWS